MNPLERHPSRIVDPCSALRGRDSHDWNRAISSPIVSGVPVLASSSPKAAYNYSTSKNIDT